MAAHRKVQLVIAAWLCLAVAIWTARETTHLTLHVKEPPASREKATDGSDKEGL